MPYIPPRGSRPQTPTTNTTPTKTSSTTPAFTNSSFESISKSSAYSAKESVEARQSQVETKVDAVPDMSDILSPTSLPRASTAASAPSIAKKRASWSNRKPVPSSIALPDPKLPSAHPFAKSPTSPRDFTLDSVPPPPAGPRSGPVPPRRSNHGRSTSNIHTPLSPAGSDMTEKSGLFWQTPDQASTAGHGDKEEGTKMETLIPTSVSAEAEDSRVRSSEQTKPVSQRTSSRSAIPELGRPISSSPSPARSTASNSQHGSPRATPTPSTDQHPLRMRFDKSLPALPLEQDNASIRPTGQRPRHQPMASTSTAPSTHLVTPRSDSHSFTQQTPAREAEGGNGEEKRKLKWAKSFMELSKVKKNKDKKEGAPRQNGQDHEAISGTTPATPSQATDLRQPQPVFSESEEDESFSVDRIPSKRKLWEAGTLFLRDEEGELVCFGDMFPKVPTAIESGHPTPPVPRTVVFFIRHFWCGQCQDFMFASLSQLDPEAVEKAGIKVIVISNGSWKIIKSYKKLFKCPFPIYVDGPRKLYQLLGMTKMTNDFGPLFKGRAAYHQRSVPGQLVHGSKNAITKMPLAYPGKLTQLGGEFILSPGYNCDFAHRMTNTSNHMEAPEVLRQAGCLHPTKFETHEITIEDNQRAELERLELEMQNWRQEREAELDRIRRRKAERRGEKYRPISTITDAGLDAPVDMDAGEEAQPAIPIPAGATSVDSESTAHNVAGSNGLPLGQASDVLAWPVEKDQEDSAERDKLDKLFEQAMRVEGLYQEEAREEASAISTLGDAAGTANGLEVRVDKQ